MTLSISDPVNTTQCGVLNFPNLTHTMCSYVENVFDRVDESLS